MIKCFVNAKVAMKLLSEMIDTHVLYVPMPTSYVIMGIIA